MDEHERNEQTLSRSDEAAAKQRVPGVFDIAFLSNIENVTELLLIRPRPAGI